MKPLETKEQKRRRLEWEKELEKLAKRTLRDWSEENIRKAFLMS